MTKTIFVKRLLPALLGASLMSAAHAGTPVIDFGVADGYNAFFYSSVSNATDVEGRMAVGGDLTTGSFSVGYRRAYGSSGPSLVVGGNVAINGGDIYTGPATNVDTNGTIGPTTSWTKQQGYGVYGGANTSSSYLALQQQSNVINFAAAKTQLTALSSSLAQQTSNGLVESKWGGTYLTGDNSSSIEVFTVTTGQLSNLYLQDINASAHVIINVTGSGTATFSGGQDGQLSALRSQVLFNVESASEVSVDTFIWGSLLANNANLDGTGHIEGNVYANSMSSAVEIGYEPYKTIGTLSPVPEPDSVAMLLAGLGLVGWMARRRRA